MSSQRDQLRIAVGAGCYIVEWQGTHPEIQVNLVRDGKLINGKENSVLLGEERDWRKRAAGLLRHESGLALSHPVTVSARVGSIPATSSIRRNTAEKSFSLLLRANSWEFM